MVDCFNLFIFIFQVSSFRLGARAQKGSRETPNKCCKLKYRPFGGTTITSIPIPQQSKANFNGTTIAATISLQTCRHVALNLCNPIAWPRLVLFRLYHIMHHDLSSNLFLDKQNRFMFVAFTRQTRYRPLIFIREQRESKN